MNAVVGGAGGAYADYGAVKPSGDSNDNSGGITIRDSGDGGTAGDALTSGGSVCSLMGH